MVVVTVAKLLPLKRPLATRSPIQWSAKRRICHVLLAICCALGQAAARAQAAGPLHLLVGVPPGGSLDASARILAEQLGREFERPVVVVNRPGANQLIATKQLVAARGKPDFLLLASAGPITTNPIFRPNDRVTPGVDLLPISMVGTSPLVLVVRGDSSASTFAQLVSTAKAHPGELTYSFGTSSFRIASELFVRAAGVACRAIPYNGAGPALNAVLRGDVHFAVLDVATTQALVKTGTLRALLVLSPLRSRMLPDIPSTVDVGLPSLEATSWAAIFAPPGLPTQVAGRLAKGVAHVLAEPLIQERLQGLGFDLAPIGPEFLFDSIAADTARSVQVIRQAGITAD